MSPPELIAHRGASRERPENTLAAFLRAVEVEADGIELDVHLTADGVLMFHQAPILPESPSAALSGRAIQTLTAEQLRTFRVRGEPMPALIEVLKAVGSDVAVYCELKGARTAGPATELLLGAAGRSAVHAFDHRQIAEARRLAPSVPRGILEASYHLDPTAPMASVDARDLWMHWEMIDEPLVTAVH